jgi:uncharacterized membrane protein YhaH (DUF805 family)
MPFHELAADGQFSWVGLWYLTGECAYSVNGQATSFCKGRRPTRSFNASDLVSYIDYVNQQQFPEGKNYSRSEPSPTTQEFMKISNWSTKVPFFIYVAAMLLTLINLFVVEGSIQPKYRTTVLIMSVIAVLYLVATSIVTSIALQAKRALEAVPNSKDFIGSVSLGTQFFALSWTPFIYCAIGSFLLWLRLRNWQQMDPAEREAEVAKRQEIRNEREAEERGSD